MALTASETIRNHATFIWSVADLLRGDYKQSEYGRVILPLVVLRRLDCVLQPTKGKVLETAARLEGKVTRVGPLLEQETHEQFYNTSPLDLRRLLDDPNRIADNLRAYIADFSPAARDVLDKFDFRTQIERLDRANLLYLVIARFCEIDLHPDAVSNLEMGYLYEELIRRFSELSNETAGEHFTPREVIRLMVNLLFIEDDRLLSRPGVVKTLFDPACGTGGMLSVAEDHLRTLNPQARLQVFGQELNAETYAVCRSDMMLKGQDASHIFLGNSFSEDGFEGQTFDYLLANPPFGVEWRKVERVIRDEHEGEGFAGRFGAGLPRINDGSFLFLQHMISKMKSPEQGGSRLAIVFNASPLFTGGAGSGESEIRRWIVENDWLEAVVALPDQLFYNTGISTYFWVVTNRKRPERRGKVQLVDARELWVKMRKSLGAKRKEISPDQVREITRLYGAFEENDRVRILPKETFGFLRITVERPLRLRWEVTDETLAVLRASPRLAKLGPDRLDGLASALAKHDGLSSTDRNQLSRKLTPTLSAAGLTKPQQQAVWETLAVRDPEAPVVIGSHGGSEPDPELRDQESVPLPSVLVRYEPDPAYRLSTIEYRKAVEDHMDTEVIPYVSDAWVDHSRTKVGYEIPITRHFYRFTSPRVVKAIDDEMAGLQTEIQRLLTEATTISTRAFPVRIRVRSDGVPIGLGDIPAAPLGKVALVQTGLTLDAARDPGIDPVTLPYLRVANVLDGRLDLAELKEVTVSRGMAARFRLRAGDVLMTEGGDPDKLGRGAVWTGEIEPCLHQNHIFAVRPDTSKLLPEYLAVVSRTTYARAYFELTASKTTGIASTSASKIGAFRVPLPTMAQQRSIVQQIASAMNKTESMHSRLVEQLSLLQERRDVLITAAVAGQLELSNEMLT